MLRRTRPGSGFKIIFCPKDTIAEIIKKHSLTGTLFRFEKECHTDLLLGVLNQLREPFDDVIVNILCLVLPAQDADVVLEDPEPAQPLVKIGRMIADEAVVFEPVKEVELVW